MNIKIFIACIIVAIGYVIFGTTFFFTDYLLRTTSVIDLYLYHIISTILILISAIGINYTKVKEQERNLAKKQVS